MPVSYTHLCAAGMAAHLAGAFAANTTLPVIGRGAVGRQDMCLKGNVQRLELGAGTFHHRPVAVRTHND